MVSRSEFADADFKYMDRRGNLFRSRMHLSVAQLLDFLNCDYEYGCPVSENPAIREDFKTSESHIMVVVDEDDIVRYRTIKAIFPDDKVLALGHPRLVSRIEELDDIVVFDQAHEASSIFLEDPSFSFDYAHILPLVEKCSILHGHTSSVMVELIGQTRQGMLVDFSDAKRLVRDVVQIFDHKFFINRRYVVSQDDTHYKIAFDGPKGSFDLQVPSHTTYLLEDEATVESLSTEIIRLLTPKLPDNIEGVGVYVYEGYNKGSHIVSRALR